MRENCLLAAGLRIWLNWILGWAMRLKNTSFRVELVTGGKAGRLASILTRRASIKRKSRAVVGLSEGAWACGLRVAITYIGYKMFMQKHLSQPTFQSTEERQEGSFRSWGRVGSWRREAS